MMLKEDGRVPTSVRRTTHRRASSPASHAAPVCEGLIFSTVADYLPVFLYVAQILVVLALASPFALVRVGR